MPGKQVRLSLLKALPSAYPRNSQAEAPSGLSRPGVKASATLERWCRLRDSNTRPPHYECPTKARGTLAWELGMDWDLRAFARFRRPILLEVVVPLR